MDQDPQDNLPPTSSSYKSKYHWLSPLRDIQPGIFNLDPASNPEDNPISGIDPELFTERATNTSARAGPFTHTGYQPRYHWLNPPRDIQPGIFNQELTSNPEDNTNFGVDHALSTKRTTNSSARAGPSTHSSYQPPGIFNQEPASNPEDNPIFGVDHALSTERTTNSSARAGPSTQSNYQPPYHWLNPLRDIQPGIFNPEPTSNPEDNLISGIDPELSTERATYSSARASPSTHSGYQHQDIQTQNHPFSWPTTSITSTNSTVTKTSLDTDTRWPAYQGQNTQNSEANMKAPSTNSAYSVANYPLNLPSKGHNSTGLQIHRYNHINLRTNNTPNVGTTPEQSDTNGGQRGPQRGQNQYMNTPHTPQYRTSLSQSHSGTSDNNANVPMAPIYTPTAPTEVEPRSTSTISHNHGNQHTNYAHVIGTTPTQTSNGRGQDNPQKMAPQKRAIQHNKTQHTPQHRMGHSQSHPDTPWSSANIPMTPINTPSTVTRFGSPSPQTSNTPRRTRENISPIRFPTPEPEESHASSSSGRNSSNLNITETNN